MRAPYLPGTADPQRCPLRESHGDDLPCPLCGSMTSDPIAPARGIVIGTLLALGLWVCALVAWWTLTHVLSTRAPY